MIVQPRGWKTWLEVDAWVYKTFKEKVVIQNEITTHFGFPKPIAIN
jgi:hypothetical protein